jgi:hypothetical protein
LRSARTATCLSRPVCAAPDSSCDLKGDARHISSDRTGVRPSPPAEKRSSPRAIQRNDMADDMTKLNE